MLLGQSPWKTEGELFLEKISGVVASEENWQMKRGKTLEPIVRRLYESATGYQAEPICCEHADAPWMLASLDGYVWEHELAVEIKCPAWQHHDMALSGFVPKHYRAQCQWQLMVSGAKLLHYVSFNNGKRFAGDQQLAILEVVADAEMQALLAELGEEFWHRVVTWRSEQLSTQHLWTQTAL